MAANSVSLIHYLFVNQDDGDGGGDLTLRRHPRVVWWAAKFLCSWHVLVTDMTPLMMCFLAHIGCHVHVNLCCSLLIMEKEISFSCILGG